MGSHARNSTRRARRRPALPDLPDLDAILGRLARTRSFFTVVLRSLKADNRDGCSEDAEVLEEALAAFNSVYDEIDLAFCAVHNGAPQQQRRAAR